MKRYILIALLALTPNLAKAAWPTIDQHIEFGLIDKIQAALQPDSRGRTNLAVVQSFARAGKFSNGDTFVHFQGGAMINVRPENGEFHGATPILGVQFRFDPFLKGNVAMSDNIARIQHGPAVFYDFHEQIGYFTYQLGWVF